MEGLCLYPRVLGMGSKVQNSTFSEHGHEVPNILLADTLTLGMGQIGQNLPFSEHGHIEYQLKGNQKMQQQGRKYLPGHAYTLPRPWGWGQKVKIQLFQNIVMLHIKIKENHECSNVVANILLADPPPPPHLHPGPFGWDQ